MKFNFFLQQLILLFRLCTCGMTLQIVLLTQFIFKTIIIYPNHMIFYIQ